VSNLDSIVRERLGLAPDASDEDVTAALEEKLPAAPVDPAAAPAPVSTPQVTTPVADNGTVVIDSGQLAELQAAAKLGVAAHARQQDEDRRGLVDAAVKDGRIPPSRRDHWLAQLAADPGAAETLAKLAPGLVPVTETGHGGNPHAGQANAEEDLSWFPSLSTPNTHTQKES
jgi:phage I-like protein